MFDKGAWHLDEVERRGLDRRQAWVHIGLAFGWLVRNGFVQDWLRVAESARFAAFDEGHITGRALLETLGGALVDDMLTDEGLAFAIHYLDPRFGGYIDDYRRYVVGGRDSDYHVPDDDTSDSRVTTLLDARYAEWREAHPGGQWSGRRPDPWSVAGVDEPPELPERLTGLPALPVNRGAPLPGGALSAVVRTPGSIGAVRDALQGDLVLVLVPDAGNDVGVVGWIEEAKEQDDGFLVGMRCLARCARDPDGGWRVHRDGVPSSEEQQAIAAVRTAALGLVRRRREAGEPLGLLALVPALDGGVLLDLVARALPLDDEEQLVVLESFDLALRAEALQAIMGRMTA